MKRLVFLLIVCIVQAGCASALRWQQYDYVVKKGDTLYSIAWNYGVDYHDLAVWNGIRSPYQIYPGEKLLVGHAAVKRPKEAARTVASTSPTTSASNNTARSTTTRKRASPSRSAPPATTITGWQWPAKGKVVGQFDPDKVAATGLNISGHEGEAVRAAASGRVVYSGNGLAGYGQLIIVKHNQHYLSAYAHNRQRLVKEGDDVEAGDKIATMGHGDEGKPLLHFEIRHDGKPVDPVHYLPSRN